RTGVTPSPPHSGREYIKADPEDTLRDIDSPDYAIPNLVFMTEKSHRRRVRTPVVVIRKHNPVTTRPRPSKRTTWPPRTKRSRKPAHQWRSKVLLIPALLANQSTSTGSPSNKIMLALTSSRLENANPLLPIEIGDDNIVIKEPETALRGHLPTNRSVPRFNDSIGYANGTEYDSGSEDEDDRSGLEESANSTTYEYEDYASGEESSSTAVTAVRRDLAPGNVTRSTKALSQSSAMSGEQRKLVTNVTETLYYD
ncbi:unnamed protein product, partial [Ixodes hexagonus]